MNRCCEKVLSQMQNDKLSSRFVHTEATNSTSVCTRHTSGRTRHRVTEQVLSGSRNIPSAFVTMVGFPPSMAATAEFVVPRSIPTTCKRILSIISDESDVAGTALLSIG